MLAMRLPRFAAALRRPFAALVLGAIVGACGTLGVADEPQAAAEPLAVLQPLVGDWDEVVQLTDDRQFTARGHCEYVLGKAYLEARYTIHTPDGTTLERMTLYGWDSARRQRRAWVFASSGVVREATWDWDAGTKTLSMQFAPTEAGVTTQSRSQFVSPDRIEWSVESRDRNDQVVFALKGVDTRR